LKRQFIARGDAKQTVLTVRTTSFDVDLI